MASFKTKRWSVFSALPAAAYLASVVFLLWLISGFYVPGKGFSALILLGDKIAKNALPDFKAVEPYVQADSYGYDGQFYAQIAVNPDLTNPALATAIDNLPYRARRALLSWTAWIIGGGDPARIIQVFSLQNLVCWLALAVVLLRWFPATGWENFCRWAGVMFCFGLCFSVRASLLDGPSLLAIASGVMLYEKGRGWWSVGILATSGLIRETNVMAASLFAEARQNRWSEWGGMIARGALVAVPCVLWMLYLNHLFGPHAVEGSGNFSMPFAAYGRKIVATADDIARNGWNEANFSSVTVLVALTVQAAYLGLRPQWSQPWWRISAPYVILMIALGDAMWAGYPGAAARALLPMALAFNVLVPKGRRWWLILLLGNASAFSAFGIFRVPATETYVFHSAPALSFSSPEGRGWKVSFDENWYGAERSRGEYWRWSRGTANVDLYNPHSFAVIVDIAGGLKSVDTREVSIYAGDRRLWVNEVGKTRVNFSLTAIRLEPGTMRLRFQTNQDARQPGPSDSRLLAFSLRDLEINVTTAAGESAEK